MSAESKELDEPEYDEERAQREERQRVRHCSKCLAIYRNEYTRCPVDGEHIVSSLTDPMIGVAIAEHYHIDELIGIGSSGRVYMAHHSRLAQRRFALKILFGDLAATATARIRFTHEAESASRLAHPNLVSVVDFGRTPAGLLYLAMDYIEGPNLAHLIARDGAMAQERAVRMGLQLCRGLAHAHDLGLVHRDFKPDNILVSSDAHGDVPRIVDFGIALSAVDLDGDPRLTAMGVTLGTPAYAAPEQASDDEVDHRADLFALGVTLYEMLTGKLPFDGSLVEMMRFNATVDPPPMMERNPEVQITSPLQAVVTRLMARDPAHRYQTAREALDALSELPRRPGTVVRPTWPTGGPANGQNVPGTPRLTPPENPRLTPPVLSQGLPGGSRPQRTTPPAGPRQTPAAHPLSSSIGARSRSSSPAIPMRSSSPVIPMRSSSPAIPMRSSSPAIPMRPSTPAISSRHSSPMMGVRASQPALGSRASAPVLAPLIIPSSTPTRMPSQPMIDVPEALSSRAAKSSRIELAPMVAQPMTPSRPPVLTLVLAVAIAAAVSAAAVVGYQRFTAKPAVAPAPAPTSSAPSAPAPSPAPTPVAPAK